MKLDASQLYLPMLLSATPIISNLTDNEPSAIYEILMPLLLGVPYDTTGPHNLVSLIMPKAAYHLAYSVSFKYPACPELYGSNIANDATPIVWAWMKAAHTNKPLYYECYNAAERATVKFLQDLIDETWYKDFKDAKLFATPRSQRSTSLITLIGSTLR